MVVKLGVVARLSIFKFEYGVILNGSQTFFCVKICLQVFEYGVILNGSQTVMRTKGNSHSLSMV